MAEVVNRKIVLASRPEGEPSKANFNLVEEDLPGIEDGQVLVRNLYLSLDPYMRGRISDAKSYAEPVAIGAVMIGATGLIATGLYLLVHEKQAIPKPVAVVILPD